MSKVSKNLKKIRNEKKLTQDVLAEKNSRNTSSNFKLGNRDFPNLKIPPQNPRLHYFHNIKFWR